MPFSEWLCVKCLEWHQPCCLLGLVLAVFFFLFTTKQPAQSPPRNHSPHLSAPEIHFGEDTLSPLRKPQEPRLDSESSREPVMVLEIRQQAFSGLEEEAVPPTLASCGRVNQGCL